MTPAYVKRGASSVTDAECQPQQPMLQYGGMTKAEIDRISIATGRKAMRYTPTD